MSRTETKLRILAFEPFDAGSHHAVREAISRHSRHHWRWVTRPGRFWKWRMRLAAIELLEQAAGERALDEQVDAIFLTSLMSAADLRALLPAQLRGTPMFLYMHENQASYPPGHVTPLSDERDLQFPLTNLTSVLAADHVFWNSAWNRDSFLDGIAAILRFGPDMKVSNVREQIERKSEVIWPPVEPPPADVMKAATVLHNANREEAGRSRLAVDHRKPTRVVWPHRWEHDKGPDELLELARRHTRALNLRWTILGEQYRTIPDALQTFKSEFAETIDHIGYEPDRRRYWQHLAHCDWVLSTARHEFFGIAVVEALLAGCLPWLPTRLSYLELLPRCAHGLSPLSPPNDPGHVCQAIQAHLQPAIAHHSILSIEKAINEVHASN